MNNHTNTTFNTSLGQKGYTILKKELSFEQLTELKESLMVKPFVPGSPLQMTKSYPVYRESVNKIYIPRYYGQELYGPPKLVKIPEGQDIDLVFNGTLRDYQKVVVDKYLRHVGCFLHEEGTKCGGDGGGGGLLELYCGWGKTDSALYIISALKKKTLVIIHTKDLMTQWMERIATYFPTARIGKIQGKVIDIDDKDIVFAMLHSLSMKEYPATMFDSFGFMIIDEVHHISSEVFSCALFKVVTKYSLGLSATMERKDGTTKVFKMFLGQVVCKEERTKDQDLVVRGITYYQPNDEEYKQLETDFRGQVASAKMLSKICNYNRRSEFILSVLQDMIAENPRQQIMVIASYKNILAYFYEAIRHRNIATVGYYVGGMKDEALKESKTKQVVLATYKMAAEGLDIKTLTTLMMITPMTSIEQPVGRILRQKHDFPAVVVDIIDMHENFQRQWFKRKAFYKKQNYRIIQTKSTYYDKDASKWNVVYEPFTLSNAIKKKEDKEDQEEDANENDDDDNDEQGQQKNAGSCLL